jgi:hypothetical protein
VIRRIFGSGWSVIRLTAQVFKVRDRVEKISRIEKKEDYPKEPKVICLEEGKVHIVC